MADGQTPPNGEPAAPAVPPSVPKKFVKADGSVDVAALGKSYVALEQKQSGGASPPSLSLPPENALDDNAGLEALVVSAGLDPKELISAHAKDGHLTPEQYVALKKKGMTRGVADQILAMQKNTRDAAIAQITVSAADMAGGSEKLDALKQWARSNLTPQQKAFYEAQANNPETALYGVEWLMAKQQKAVGSTGSVSPINSGTPASSSTGAPTSTQLVKLSQDTTPEGREKYLAAAKAFNAANLPNGRQP